MWELCAWVLWGRIIVAAWRSMLLAA
jgi:hypothetical protein